MFDIQLIQVQQQWRCLDFGVTVTAKGLAAAGGLTAAS